MLDTHFRHLAQPLFEKGAERLERWGCRPLLITCAALVVGLLAALSFGLGFTFLPLGLLWLSGLLDVLDGTLARRTGSTSSFGALCDLLFDRMVEMAVILAAALRFPNSRLACVFLLCAILFCFSIFLIVGNLSARQSEKAFYYQAGLTERTETFIIFSGVIVMPQYLTEIFMIFAALVVFTGCQRFREAVRLLLPVLAVCLFSASAFAADWQATLDTARGTTVNFYAWGGDTRVNRWLDEWVAPRLLESHGVTLDRVAMDPSATLGKLLAEKQHGGSSPGTADVLWINGENFASAKAHGLLQGPFVAALPNSALLADVPENTTDFGVPTGGYEAPWGRAQIVFYATPQAAQALESGPEGLLAYAKAHPGRLTYSAPPDFTGSAFLRTLAYGLLSSEAVRELHQLGEHQYSDAELQSRAEALLQPLFAYLKTLKPFLQQQGEHYPATVALLANHYADGEVDMGFSYTPYFAQGKVGEGIFPPDTTAFVLATGTVGNTHFLAIPFNASNKAAALVLINELLSPDAQVAKLDLAVWGDLPVLSPDVLAKNSRFAATQEQEDGLFSEALNARRKPEFPARLVPVFDALWRGTVLK